MLIQVNLEGLIAQGCAVQPSGIEEACPSNWVERGTHVLQQVGLAAPYNLQPRSVSEGSPESEPMELCNISNLINHRFCIFPPIITDDFNPILQEHNVTSNE